jgi:hypothetical protein
MHAKKAQEGMGYSDIQQWMEVNGQLHDPAVLHAGKQPTVRTEWDDRLTSEQGWAL